MPDSSSDNLSDYDSDKDSESSLEIIVSPRKLKEEFAKQLAEERKAAAEKGVPTYSDGTAVVIGTNGRPRSAKMVRLERMIKKRKELRAEVMRYITSHIQKPYVRKQFEYISRDIPSKNHLFKTKKKVTVTAGENYMCVKIERRLKKYDD